ncbi:hypothetical protein BJX65DRAFT_313013 [Aspergillus insuetus]
MVSFRDDPLRPSHTCPLCGIALYPDAYSPFVTGVPAPGSRRSTSTEPRPWSTEARAIIARDIERGDIYLSGLGVIGIHSSIRVPLDDEVSYTKTQTQRMHMLELSRGTDMSNTMVAAVHGACWSLLRCRLGDEVSECDVVASVFYQLYGAPRVVGGFDLGFEYGVTSTERADAELADPCRIPSSFLEAIEATAPLALSFFGVGDWGGIDDTATHPTDAFKKISTELIHEIMSYLSLHDVCCLRLTCKTLLAASTSLSQTYWRARFLPGNEADFLYPDLKTTRDWRRLFFGLCHCLREGDHVPGLANRRRIGNLLEPIAALVALSIELPDTPHGLEVRAVRPPDPRISTRPPGTADARPFRTNNFRLEAGLSGGHPQYVKPLRCFCADRAGKDFHIMLYRTFLPFRKGFSIPKGRIGVSTIQIGARRYICGLKYVPSNGSSRVDDPVQAGFPMAEEEWIEIARDTSLEMVEVAVRPEGLVGVRFLMEDEGASTPWVGQCSGPGVSRGFCTIPAGLGESGLLLGFDRYKIVALGPCILTDSQHESESFHRGQAENTGGATEQYMWTPHPPTYEGLTLGPLISGRSAQYGGGQETLVGPLCNMDFGGPDGSLLSSLTRLVFRMEYATPFVGLECHYRDQPTRIFGDTSSTACELSFLVDGATGERVDRVDLIVRAWVICGIKLSTNHGRSASFGTIEDLGRSETIPLPSIPDGKIITGFVTSPQDGRNSSGYAQIGLQSQKPHPSVPQAQAQPQAKPPTTILYRPVPVPPEEDARRTTHHKQRTNIGGIIDYTYHTWAPLTSIRRITASTGMQGRSRSERDISGLRFEYYDDTPSVIVGQWCVPQPHTAVDFEGGEVVNEVKVWMRRSRQKPPPGGYFSRPMVTVTGIRIQIEIPGADSRSVTFFAPATDIDNPEEKRWYSVHWQKDWRNGKANVGHGHEEDDDNVDLLDMTTFTQSATAAQELYNDAAAIYDRHNKDTTTTIARFMLSLAPRLDTDPVVLDNACGTGGLTFSLLKAFQTTTHKSARGSPKVHSVDIALAMVDAVIQKSQSLSVTEGVIQAAVLDAQKLSFAENTFTHSYMNFGISFLHDSARGAAEIYRTLKPGGAAFISTWQALGHLDLLRISQRTVRPQDTREDLFRPMYLEEWFTEEKLRSTLIAGGFEDHRITIHKQSTALVGDHLDGLVERMLLPFGKKMDGWSEEERVRLRDVIKEGLTEDEQRSCSVDMVDFVAVAVR